MLDQVRCLFTISTFLSCALLGAPALAQEVGARGADDPSKADSQGAAATTPDDSERSLEACRDEADNDGDGHIDCRDQDCEIFAICADPQNTPAKQVPKDKQNTHEPVAGVERGLACRDGVDNDHDGKVDCQQASCQDYFYCETRIYERPEPPDKPQGFLVSLGFGAALPNFRWPTAKTDSVYGDNIPFDPDMGGMAQLKLGYSPLKWLALGVDLHAGATGATNYTDFISLKDDPSKYKYNGVKGLAHVGAFARLQWIQDRFVPYVDVSAGYSFARYRWYVYDPANDWDEIEGWDSDCEDEHGYPNPTPRVGIRDERTQTFHHLTLAVSPGFDVYVAKRLIAIGARAWLPVYAGAAPETDNIGIMLSVTWTPTWREPKRIKPEYRDPFSI